MPELSADDAEFWRAVRSLPRRQAQVIALHYLEDRPVAEIAQILGTAEGTVKRHLHDGRQTLARRLRLEEGD
jgi:RNA polymerase sigma-70 factor (ECF subfamily)